MLLETISFSLSKSSKWDLMNFVISNKIHLFFGRYILYSNCDWNLQILPKLAQRSWCHEWYAFAKRAHICFMFILSDTVPLMLVTWNERGERGCTRARSGPIRVTPCPHFLFFLPGCSVTLETQWHTKPVGTSLLQRSRCGSGNSFKTTKRESVHFLMGTH